MANYLGLPKIIQTHYPRTTHLAAGSIRWERRIFRVLGIRDLVKDPLTIDEFIRRPMTRRSRYLINVFDLQKNRYRSIYQRSMLEWYRETPLRVGIYEGPKLIDITTHNWGPTLADRRGLARFLGKFEGVNMGELRIGIFSDDLELITCDGFEV